jgi:hypothetical protein
MVLSDAPQYDPVTNNCRHFENRLETALTGRGLNAFKVIIATTTGAVIAPATGLRGVHAMTGLTVAKGNPGEHDIYVEPQTGEVFYQFELEAYLIQRMGIPDPVVINYGKPRN